MLKIYIKLLPLQGVTNGHALTQGVASLALGYVLLGFQPVLTKSELESNQKIKNTNYNRKLITQCNFLLTLF